MSLERVRKSLTQLFGIQISKEEQPNQEQPKQQTDQKLQKQHQMFKNKFVSIQKKDNKLNSYKFALEKLKEYNLTTIKTKDLLECPIISYITKEQQKKILENIITKPRWSNEHNSSQFINIKSEDEKSSFFFCAQYTKDENQLPNQSKLTAKKSLPSSRTSEFNTKNTFLRQVEPAQINNQKDEEAINQNQIESKIPGKMSENKFIKLKSQDSELNHQDVNLNLQKNQHQKNDCIPSIAINIQKAETQDKLPEQQVLIQSEQQINTNPKVVENKQESKLQTQIDTKIEPQIQNTLSENPFTQNNQSQLFNPPWLNSPISQNQVSFNLFQQPLIQQSPQVQVQQQIAQPILYQYPMNQQSQNLFPFQNQQTNNFPNQNLFNQQTNLFQNNQSNQSFNLFNQSNLFQQQTSQQPLFQQQQSLFQQQPSNQQLFQQQPSNQQLFQQQPSSQQLFQQQPSSQSIFQQQPSSQSLFQQQPSSQSLFEQQPLNQSLFQQQPSSQQLFQQQPSSQQLFQQQPSSQSVFQQQPSSQSIFQQSQTNNLFQTSSTQSSNQLFQQPNQQANNLFTNNDQRRNTQDLFSTSPIQNTPNLFQQNQNLTQDSLFSLNSQSQSNISQQRVDSQTDRYKKNLGKQTNNRLF